MECTQKSHLQQLQAVREKSSSKENWWKEARTRMKERYSQNSEEILENHLTQLYDLLHRCREDNNKRTEREVLADIAKIHSLETKKVDITSNGQPISININLND